MKKNRFKNEKQKMLQMVSSTAVWICCMPAKVAAATGTTTTGIEGVDNILSTIKTLFLGVVGGIGLVILIKGVADMAQAYQQQDSHGMYDGAKGLVAGGIMVAIGPILTAFGIA